MSSNSFLLKSIQSFTSILALIFVIGTLLTIFDGWSTSSVHAISAHDSGFDHGCDDAKISNSDNRYINQPEKGPSFHTKAFMNGYDDGFDACLSHGDGRDNRDTENINNNNDNFNKGIEQLVSRSTDFPHDDKNVLDIEFAKATKDSVDYYHVKGSIKNIGSHTLEYVKVTAHFYDKNNSPIGITTCCYAEPSDIEPGHTSSFDSFVAEGDMDGTPKYFRLSFDWNG